MPTAPFTTGPLTAPCADDAYATLEGYRAQGGYDAAKRVLKKETPESVADVVGASGLRGHASATFAPRGAWQLAPNAEGDGPRYLVGNAGAFEPGAFQERWLLECAPHLVKVTRTYPGGYAETKCGER